MLDAIRCRSSPGRGRPHPSGARLRCIVTGVPFGGASAWPVVTSLSLQIVLVLGDRIPSVDSMSYFETGRNFLNGDGYTRGGSPGDALPAGGPGVAWASSRS